MQEPSQIISFIENDIHKGLKLFGKKILITGGPTYEPIDAVRFIGNFSSGKMGIELAKTASSLGADVVLITGPTSLSVSNKSIKVVNVMTADEMFKKTKEFFVSSDISVLSAAVSDFKPKKIVFNKIKKDNNQSLLIDLVPNVDILNHLGTLKRDDQLLVGFALETNEIENAIKKIKSKNEKTNNYKDAGAGFNYDTNKITFINNKNNIIEFELKSKHEVSIDIFNQIDNL